MPIVVVEAIKFVLVALFLALSYRHIRNAVFQKVLLGEDHWFCGNTVSRVLWAASLCIGYGTLVCDGQHLGSCIVMFIATQFSIRVTHGYIMDLGRHPVPEVRWPSLFMPQPTQAEWDAMSLTDRAIFDGVQGACVGLVRGLIFFLPLLLVGYHLPNVLAGTLVVTIGTPVSYALGYLTPFKLYAVTPKSTEWGEMYTGVMWAIALTMIG